jgi:predicted NBD/HSP70 family sugar kinase
MGVPIVFDIGGTKMRVATVQGNHPDAVEIIDTPRNPNDGITTLVSYARRIAGERGISELVGDISGVVKEGVVIKSPHLPEWNKTDLALRLQNILQAPVTLFNDAELVALGEYEYGIGFHSKAMAYITVSTGVGSALIVDGAIDKDGEFNYEIGHQLIRGKELEAQVSGTAVKKMYGVEPKDFNNDTALFQMAEILGEAIYNTVLAWSPDTVVLGGSMITGERNTIPIAHVEETVNRLVTTIYPHPPRIVKAKLSKIGGLYGGMAYLAKRK